jgi:Tfp pilus assembly protein PilE
MIISKKKGFTLLYSVLVMGVLLSIVYSILNISYKQISLSSVAKDSQVSFYMADTGAECAQFWDNQGSFSTTSPSLRTITCHGQNFSVGGRYGATDSVANSSTVTCPVTITHSCSLSQFTVTLQNTGLVNPPEVVVSLYKDNSTGETTVISSGHNTNQANNLRRIERSVKLVYTPRGRLCTTNGDIMVLIDVSGSVRDNQANLKTAAKSLIQNLFNSPSDIHVGIVTFGNSPLMTTGMRLTGPSGLASLNSAIDNINIIGSEVTNVQAALRLAYYEFAGLTDANQGNNINYTGPATPDTNRPDTDHPNYIVLLTDGAPSAFINPSGSYNTAQYPNPSGSTPLLHQAADEADNLKLRSGASIYAIGIGTDDPLVTCEGYSNSNCLDFIEKSIAGGPDHLSNYQTQTPGQQLPADSGLTGTEKYVYSAANFDTELPVAINALTQCR